MKKVTEGVVDVIVYPSAADKTKNRGFSFVEYKDHKAAAMARRKLMPGKFTTASEIYAESQEFCESLEKILPGTDI